MVVNIYRPTSLLWVFIGDMDSRCLEQIGRLPWDLSKGHIILLIVPRTAMWTEKFPHRRSPRSATPAPQISPSNIPPRAIPAGPRDAAPVAGVQVLSPQPAGVLGAPHIEAPADHEAIRAKSKVLFASTALIVLWRPNTCICYVWLQPPPAVAESCSCRYGCKCSLFRLLHFRWCGRAH